MFKKALGVLGIILVGGVVRVQWGLLLFALFFPEFLGRLGQVIAFGLETESFELFSFRLGQF